MIWRPARYARWAHERASALESRMDAYETELLHALTAREAVHEAQRTLPSRGPPDAHTFRCVNAHRNKLHSQFVKFKRFTNAFLNCEADIPLRQYGDSAGTFGYEFSNDEVSTIFTTALDVTASGDDVGAWFIINTCNTTNPAPRPLLRGLNLRPHSSGLRP
jgi:hypothetical protein